MATLRFTEEDWFSCCGSSRFAKEMAKVGPFGCASEAVEISREIWWNKVDVPGWLEAFAAHPRIGDLKAVSATKSDWCEGEQSAAVSSADDQALKNLAMWNKQYEAKFGFIFLVCATGKSSSQILELLKARMNNRPYEELQVAAAEQQKITELRIAKLITASSEHRAVRCPSPLSAAVSQGDAAVDGRLNKIESHVLGNNANQEVPQSATRPPITTHVLDVSLGRPAEGVEVQLEFLDPVQEKFVSIGHSTTNEDGRAGRLMQPSAFVEAGQYRITFNTGKYLACAQKLTPFYPSVSIVFDILPSQSQQHFHVPLLLSPYSFTTYRGS